MEHEAVRELARKLSQQIQRVVMGQSKAVDLLLIALLSEGHVLLEGVPGTAKTLLARTFAAGIALKFNRIQFTPDLMPGDITGTNLFNFQTSSFVLTRGPIFTEILLADELNRSPPKTQAALLQAMAERVVTIDGVSHELGSAFMVIATQNPIEQEGTYPLPEAQLDRFMLSIHVDYPSFDQEVDIVARTTTGPVAEVNAIAEAEEVLELQRTVLAIVTAPDVVRHAVEIVSRTRPATAGAPEMVKQYVSWGAGPRASQHLILAAKARAALQGRPHVSREDVDTLATAVLGHRVLTTYHAEANGIGPHDLVDAVLGSLG